MSAESPEREPEEQLAFDLAPKTLEERLAEYLAYVSSRTPLKPYDPTEAPIPY